MNFVADAIITLIGLTLVGAFATWIFIQDNQVRLKLPENIEQSMVSRLELVGYFPCLYSTENLTAKSLTTNSDWAAVYCLTLIDGQQLWTTLMHDGKEAYHSTLVAFEFPVTQTERPAKFPKHLRLVLPGNQIN
jgi:hypothetical protein